MAGLGSINGVGHGNGLGLGVIVTDHEGKKVGSEVATSKWAASGDADSTQASQSFASQALASSMTAISTTIDSTLATLENLSTSLTAVAGQAAKSQGNGNGLTKFATTATIAPVSTSSSAATTRTATTAAAGATSTGATGGASALAAGLQAGTDATVVDLGAVRINGVTTVLGAVQAPYMTSRQAAEYAAGAINANDKNSVTAAVSDQGALVLSSKDGGAISIEKVGISTTGVSSQLVDIGFQAGTYGSTVTASSPIASPLFAENFDATYRAGATSGWSSATSGTTSATTAAPAPTTTVATVSSSTTTDASGSKNLGKGYWKNHDG